MIIFTLKWYNEHSYELCQCGWHKIISLFGRLSWNKSFAKCGYFQRSLEEKTVVNLNICSLIGLPIRGPGKWASSTFVYSASMEHWVCGICQSISNWALETFTGHLVGRITIVICCEENIQVFFMMFISLSQIILYEGWACTNRITIHIEHNKITFLLTKMLEQVKTLLMCTWSESIRIGFIEQFSYENNSTFFGLNNKIEAVSRNTIKLTWF